MPSVLVHTMCGMPVEIDIDDVVWKFDDLVYYKGMECSLELQADNSIAVFVNDKKYFGEKIGTRGEDRITVKYYRTDPADPFPDDWI